MATFILPHACMELGLTHLRANELDQANVWFEKAKRDYSGYLLEMMVHFRVHCGQRALKHIQRKQAQQLKQSLQEAVAKEEETIDKTCNVQRDSVVSTDESSATSSCNVSVDESSSDSLLSEGLCSTSIESDTAGPPTSAKRPLTTSIVLQRSTDVKPSFLEQIEPVSTQL